MVWPALRAAARCLRIGDENFPGLSPIVPSQLVGIVGEQRTSLLHGIGVVVFRVRRDQRLGVSPEIAPAQQIQADFAPERSLVSPAARAAVAHTEPQFNGSSIGRCSADAERGAANAGLSFVLGHNNFYSFHSVPLVLTIERMGRRQVILRRRRAHAGVTHRACLPADRGCSKHTIINERLSADLPPGSRLHW